MWILVSNHFIGVAGTGNSNGSEFWGYFNLCFFSIYFMCAYRFCLIYFDVDGLYNLNRSIPRFVFTSLYVCVYKLLILFLFFEI